MAYVTVMVVSSSLFIVLVDKNGVTMELSVLEFTNGKSGFRWLLVDDNAATLGRTIVVFENVSFATFIQFVGARITGGEGRLGMTTIAVQMVSGVRLLSWWCL